MNQLVIIHEILNKDSWEIINCDDILECLESKFDYFPENARIYHNRISLKTDVTPKNEAQVEHLKSLTGRFFVINQPKAAVVPYIPWIIAAIVISLVAVVALTPKANAPTPTMRNTNQTSSNNELSERANKPRLLARIPDIFGTVRSTPDLIALPYKIYENHEEVEFVLMCIGRGEYQIHDVRDDTTYAREIAGLSVEVYGPNKFPVQSQPSFREGNVITELPLNTKRSNSVNGQILRPSNSRPIQASPNQTFSVVYPNYIDSARIDFSEAFYAGDDLQLTNAIAFTKSIDRSQDLTLESNNSFSFYVDVNDTELINNIESMEFVKITNSTFSDGITYRFIEL